MDTQFLDKAFSPYTEEGRQYNEKLNDAFWWCCDRYKDVKKKYDGLPYSHHIRMVASTAIRHFSDQTIPQRYYILVACFGHDLIEDARLSYNDLNKKYGGRIADLIFSVTDYTGRTREDRACYDKTKQADFGPYLKMCDRYANGAYSKLTRSEMYERYAAEYPKFRFQLKDDKDKNTISLWNELDNLFEFKDISVDIPLYS